MVKQKHVNNHTSLGGCTQQRGNEFKEKNKISLKKCTHFKSLNKTYKNQLLRLGVHCKGGKKATIKVSQHNTDSNMVPTQRHCKTDNYSWKINHIDYICNQNMNIKWWHTSSLWQLKCESDDWNHVHWAGFKSLNFFLLQHDTNIVILCTSM